MKVGVLTSFVSRNAGGMYNSVRYLSHAVQRLGHQVQVHAYNDSATEDDVHEWSNLNIKLFESRKICGLHFGGGVAEALQKFDSDISHVNGLWLMSAMIHDQWSRKSQTPYLIAPRGMLDPWALKNSGWKKQIVGALFQKKHLCAATCLHALCESEALSMRAYGLENPIAVIPNGVSIPDSADCSLKKYRPQMNRKTLLFLGRIHPKKGLPMLLEAWAKLKKQNSIFADEWLLAIAGWSENDHINQLRNQAACLDIENDIKFIGSVYGLEKEEVLRSANAFILPSYSEGLPMSVLEAWSFSLPSLITPECNLSEGFEHKAAIRIETTVESIVEGLQKVFAMSDLELADLGQRAFGLVKDRFTWPKIAKQTEAVYHWILGGGEAPKTVRFL